MDGLQMLEDDHRRVEKLFKEFEEAGDRAHKTKQGIVEKAIEELTIHSQMEEQVLYPTARDQAEDAEDQVLEAFEEHSVVEELMEELKTMGPEDESFDAKFTVLMENVRHHVEEEEGELFPKIRKALGSEALEEIGAQMQQIREQHRG